MIVRAGQIRHRVTIQTVTETQDTQGGVTRSWAEAVKRWARITPIAGGETVLAGRAQSTTRFEVQIRSYTSLDTTDYRILFGTRVLNIENIRDLDERGREQILECREDLSGND
jgi:SPP1 family predicted phage head-tail adaptor